MFNEFNVSKDVILSHRKGERDGDEDRPWDAARALALRDRDREEEARNLNAVDHGTEEEPPVAPVCDNMTFFDMAD